MSNYQRLISYIYTYEGGIKGKNTGFAKLETRNGQCRLTVNVKKIFVGGNPLGVYLLSGDGELRIGTLFARNGAGEFRVLTRIYVPLSKALYATFGLFSLVGVWNSYFDALLYIQDQSRQPIQMVLRKIVFTSGTSGMAGATEMLNNGELNALNVQYACIIATIGPILLVYPFIQKYFAQGMQLGAVKG